MSKLWIQKLHGLNKMNMTITAGAELDKIANQLGSGAYAVIMEFLRMMFPGTVLTIKHVTIVADFVIRNYEMDPSSYDYFKSYYSNYFNTRSRVHKTARRRAAWKPKKVSLFQNSQ